MDMENKNQLGVFDDVREAIQAAYDAQRVLMQDYTTEDRDRFIAKIKENFLKIIDEETTKEFVETGYRGGGHGGAAAPCHGIQQGPHRGVPGALWPGRRPNSRY